MIWLALLLALACYSFPFGSLTFLFFGWLVLHLYPAPTKIEWLALGRETLSRTFPARPTQTTQNHYLHPTIHHPPLLFFLLFAPPPRSTIILPFFFFLPIFLRLFSSSHHRPASFIPLCVHKFKSAQSLIYNVHTYTFVNQQQQQQQCHVHQNLNNILDTKELITI